MEKFLTLHEATKAGAVFKNYGIILQLKPIVDVEDRITSSVHAEVSNMSGESVDGQPILDRRRADAVITVRSGSTMVIGGLMDSSEQKTIRKFPFLGDIPIIGEFFKYASKSKDKQELIILVTPYLVEEDDLSQVRMSDSMKEFYEKGLQEKEAMNEVNVNEPADKSENETTNEAENKTVSGAENETVNEAEDEILNESLDDALNEIINDIANRPVNKSKNNTKNESLKDTETENKIVNQPR